MRIANYSKHANHSPKHLIGFAKHMYIHTNIFNSKVALLKR